MGNKNSRKTSSFTARIVPESNLDVWIILNSIFTDASSISKSQFYDQVKSNKMHVSEVRIWIDVLRLTIVEWIEYCNNPIPENYKLVRDVEEWAFRDSLAISMISDSLFLAYQIDPEIFKKKFRAWIRKTKPVPRVATRIAFEFTEPLESVEIEIELIGFDLKHNIM